MLISTNPSLIENFTFAMSGELASIYIPNSSFSLRCAFA